MTKEQKENKEEVKKGKRLNVQQWLIIVGMLVFIVVGVFLQQNVTFNVENQSVVAGLALSIMLNVLILIVVFALPIGQQLVKRFRQQLMYRSGNFVNTIMITKNGTAHEKFLKIDKETGTFKYNNHTYARNPSLLFNFKRIPTYFHREGTPDPINPFESQFAFEMSTAELDIAMNSKGTFDVKMWLEKNAMIIMIVAGVVLLCSLAAMYFGYTTFEMLRDGTYNSAKMVASAAVVSV